ncbi:GH35 family endo-1,4-beta-xylanase [Evansella vedderi]|uniref:Beta-xylanase n=1 Tax=Evansella vedderi TaxID=38282 RepID=A0ABT9ZP14_9BACI|nr:endo-1,4-beta-xylanase [Evansella vedderi]MDQ0252967.1 GH35 family endo-1,4-beta-xylanase [Evansella vedderi]
MRKKRFKSLIIQFLVLLLVLPPGLLHTSTSTAANDEFEPEVVKEFNFEAGEQGWTPRGTSVLSSVEYEGSTNGGRSLLVSDRQETWSGAGVDLTPDLEKGAEYRFTANVKLKEAAESQLQLMVLEGFTWIDGKQVSDTDNDWVELEGTFKFESNISQVYLYVETANDTKSFYVDYVKVEMISPPSESEEDDNIIDIPEEHRIPVFTDFEDGTTQGWEPNVGSVELTVTDTVAKNGDYSLFISNRLGSNHSAVIEALDNMYAGYTYDISLWVKLAEGEAPTRLQVTRAETNANGTNYWPPVVNPVTVTADEWVLLEGTYTLPPSVTSLQFFVEEPWDPDQTTGVPFYIDDFKVEVQIPKEIEDIPPLKDVYAEYFDIGAAIEPNQMLGQHGEMLKKHYNMLVAENIMKPDGIQPTEGNFNWTNADAMIEFAEENGMDVRFHTLVWHSQTPSWFFNDVNGNPMVVNGQVADPDNLEANKKLLLDRMETHIRAVVERYYDRVDSWDVVNEVIVTGEADGFRRSPYYLITGKEFIHRAFEVTAEVLEEKGGHGKLYYNDYTTHIPAKRDLIYDMVVEMIDKGIRIDGIGHQTHINIQNPPMQQITDSIELFGELGLDNEITELDVSIYTNNNQNFDGFDNIPSEIFEIQAERYGHLFSEFRRLSDYISSVVFWGIGDDHTWLHNFPVEGRTNAPFVFDHHLQAKPAYWAIVNFDEEIPSLSEFFTEHFQIGAAIEPYQMGGVHGEMLDKHYNSIVAENIMKPLYIQPREGEFNFERLDEMMNYAKENGKTMRYHTLLWHSQSPGWFHQDENGTPLEANEENKQLVLDRVETHVDTVVRHVMENHPGVVDSWDVVNEVIDVNGPNGMRNSEWYRLTGKDFVKVAFNTAKSVLDEFNDDSKLYINDYNTHEPAKRDALFDLVMELTEEGVPIDGVGHQTHVNIRNPHINQITESIELFANEGFDIQITELDMSIYTDNTTVYETFDDIPDEVLLLQAYRYQELFNEFVRLSDSISNVTFWGIGDDHTWLTNRPIPRQNAPFVFDQNLQPKLAFWALVDPSRLPAVTKEANATYGTPIINGEVDLLWETISPTVIGAGEEFSATFRTTWDENHLYVLAEVTDATVNENDSVEVFVNDVHVTFTRGEESAVQSVVEVDGGYLLEAAVALEGSLEVNDKLAFDVRITDAETGNLLSWNDPTHSQEENVNYGELTLLPEVKVTEAFYGTPVIDAELDDVWQDALEIYTGTWVEGSDGATATVRTLWDEEYLYVFAEVSDPLLSKASGNVWEQDSVEIFIDQNNAKTEYYQSDDGQFRVNFANEQSYNGFASASTFETATRLTDEGYIVEAAIKFTEIDPTEGTIIGFDFQVNDDANGNGSRDSVAIWNDPTGQSFQNTSRFGVLRLSMVQPEEPGKPCPPVAPGKPEQPGKPCLPVVPGKPEQPGKPNPPVVPGKPEEAGKPELLIPNRSKN